MPNPIILEKIELLRTLIEDSEMDSDDKLEAEGVLREIEEEARK